MAIKTYKPYTPSRRHMTGSDFSEITKKTSSQTYNLMALHLIFIAIVLSLSQEKIKSEVELPIL